MYKMLHLCTIYYLHSIYCQKKVVFLLYFAVNTDLFLTRFVHPPFSRSDMHTCCIINGENISEHLLSSLPALTSLLGTGCCSRVVDTFLSTSSSWVGNDIPQEHRLSWKKKGRCNFILFPVTCKDLNVTPKTKKKKELNNLNMKYLHLH